MVQLLPHPRPVKPATPAQWVARIVARRRKQLPIPVADPIRGELLGAEALAERMRAVARSQRLAPPSGRRRKAPLLTRLEESRLILQRAQERIGHAAENGVDIGPAGDWLLDNYHVVLEHIHEVRASLPADYYRELPELVSGRLAGYPRVYELAITLIAHSEGRIELHTVDLATHAFQQVAPLSIGELWAVPAMLRLGLLENVRRMALRTVQRLDEVEAADRWASRLRATADAEDGTGGPALRAFIAGHPPLTPIFITRFLRQLRVSDPPFTPLLWLEEYITEEGLSGEEAAARSADRLAITQVAMAHSIESLRAIGRMEWQSYVERCSLLEAALRQDPSGFYPRMTFATRDEYRHVVERIARRTGRAEVDVAAAAVQLAVRAVRAWPDDQRTHHVGYYLVAEGRAELETATGYRSPRGEALYRWVLQHPNLVYVGGVLAALATILYLVGSATPAGWPIVVIAALLPATDIAVNVVNQLVTIFLPPRLLPKLDLRRRGVGADGIPAEYRTAVVVPILFGSVAAVEEALEHLEVQYLANPEVHLHFALLSDFTDAPAEHQEGDVAILAAAVRGIRRLNARYAGHAQDRFYLFHRARRWNPQQGAWLGWERKRGKLAQFNRFVRGHAHDAFHTVVGDIATIRQVRYVITLDSDTVLPPDAAALLVGAMAHPLNRAVYDPERRRVVRGYGILQPRVGVSLPSAHRSRFAALHSGHPGVDPYTTAVSDVYQDLYGEGSFTGKGIYDVDAFEQATHGRFPENTLLSHDLIEGSYARAGLATEIEVYDEYPSRYLVHARRKHRWIRGDWQLVRWLFPRVPGPDGPEPNRLSLVSRWKIADNLRRSVTELAQLSFLVAGWTILPGSPLRWTVLGLLAITAPWIVSLALAAVRVPLDKSWRAYYAAVARDAVTSAQQAMLAVVFLPHQAWLSLDAIVRTFWRLGVSRRNLLEWQTASHTEQQVAGTAASAWRTMWPAVVLAAVVLFSAIALEWLRLRTGSPGLLLLGEPTVAARTGARLWAIVLGAVPLAAAWVAAPAVANALNTPLERRALRVPRARRRQAIRYALLHWRFFERFVGQDSAWLAPDNFQETPSPQVALRTSPTNIGLQLLATVSAADLGFITTEHMAERLEHAFAALDRMRRFRGHFYNWYELPACEVLEPAYISTVDSGNLAGHLVALRQACLDIPHRPVFDQSAWRVVSAALSLAEERVAAAAATGPAERRALAPVHEALAEARAALPRRTPAAATGLDALALPLRRALAALERARTAGTLSTEAATDSLDWIAWALHLLDEQRARVAALPPRTAAAGAGEDAAVYPSLAELALHDVAAATLVARLAQLAARAGALVAAMDFRFLYDPHRKLFAIGYQQATHSLDTSYYDLLASEARLASFLAVARNDVPVEHWFRLGRALTHAAGATSLVSWSGSMFEYLMPLLVMQSFPSTLLDQACNSAFARHVAHGEEHGTPWGASESAYNLRDRYFTYQYRAFGVPNLALKRGLAQDHVIAPYASALALMVDAPRALANLAALEDVGALGPYGFRDAVDYTRPEPGSRYAVVGNYMAHHVGMSLVALTNALTAQRWQHRFHNDPMVRAAELLLHERIPRRLELRDTQVGHPTQALPDAELEAPAIREFTTAATPQPSVALLGHLPYTLMVTNAGSGYSRFEGLAVTRWRADGTRDHTGQFCYVKDVVAGRVWSAAHQPVCSAADWYLALLATDRVIFHRADGEIETRTEICVVPGDAAEVRRVTVTNNGREARELELTSYGEVVLTPAEDDRAHPAFANLFVETEWHEWCSAITAIRRPRSAAERTLWGVHVVTAAGAGEDRLGAPTCETDRARFLGRGRSPRNPIAVECDGALAGTVGAVLDPVFAIRVRLRLQPGRSASVAFTTLVAATREHAFALADRYHDPQAAQRALDMAWTSAQVELRELNISPADAALYQELAGHLFFGDPALGAPPAERERNRGSQPQLWALGVSGDWPILLATIDSKEGLPTLRQLFAAHRYWRRRGMTVDLVVLNSLPTSYLQELHEAITAILFASSEAGIMDRPGGIFVRRSDAIEAADLLMLRATARVHIACDGGSLARAVSVARPPGTADKADVAPALPQRSARPLSASPRPHHGALHGLFVPGHREASGGSDPAAGGADVGERVVPGSTAPPDVPASHAADPQPVLRFDNGFGGLTADDDYVIRVRGDDLPPAPWVNVVANPKGGFIVSERGAGCTWAENSYFFRLTPWHNDPVSDPPGDVIYLRDDESGEFWSATPAPAGAPVTCTVTHGAGVSTFAQEHAGISSLLTMGVPEHDAVKLSILRLKNRGTSTRRLTITTYAEWTLGAQREHTRHQVHTTFEPALGAIFARNGFDPQFAGQVAFCALSEPISAHSGDRREFLGRHGDLATPAALRHGGALTGATGAIFDPCAALQCTIELAPGETRELAVLLGAAEGPEAAGRLVEAYRTVEHAGAALATARAAWAARLGTIRVRTPEPSFDAMLNRWTLYQALSSRMWARSALYQSSGAYGFRDQLQDVMAFVYAEPALAREHILRAAARQFVEGDVQHWWHPQSGRGVRTRFSDDLAWLPFVVDHYVRVTGDSAVLDEVVPFLAMRQLAPHEQELYDLPQVSDERASLHEHCLRALRRACTRGEHGLPLIGSGDWNDGYSRVGIEGRGESIWLAWFLAATLRGYAAHTEARGDVVTATDLRATAAAYTAAVESHGWDGAWYRRAYFDDGTPLGSAHAEECRIDSIAQSWSVISGGGDPDRQAQAMASLERHLVDEQARLLMLLTPPFDTMPQDPGYIKGYLPGVRENGAQYTHAALWAVLATALRGEHERAFELYQLINPLTHASTAEQVASYKVEPYVVAADVYTAAGQVGRGGWTWYTGAASWMYRVGLESILGFTRLGNTLLITPRVPARWPEYGIEYQFGGSTWAITVHEPAGVAAHGALVTVDGTQLDTAAIPLVDDGARHEVTIRPRAPNTTGVG
jgi:cyclic beta-1,2-glucan synthetase